MLGAMIGRYRVLEQIGEGGMAVVYLAQHPLIGRRVAIKVLRPELSQEPELVSRFLQEARTQAMIVHPGVVDVFDFGQHESGCAYIVMELLEGYSLQALLAHHGRVPWPVALELTRQIAWALAASHRFNVVHRDLKPANLLLVPDAQSWLGVRPKVLDFGVAKLAAGSMRTRFDVILGTPRYMAPEQAQSATNVDGRADVYALGCILYEMVCGRPPFEGKYLAELVHAHLTQVPLPPRQHNPEVPEALEWIILHTLAKRPADRVSSMSDLATMLGHTAGQVRC
jgi:eukaryotic-like serine/threonine-protein kinase